MKNINIKLIIPIICIVNVDCQYTKDQMIEILESQVDIKHCKDDGDCGPDHIDGGDQKCMKVEVDEAGAFEFYAEYCLPIGFCSQSLTHEGKDMKWTCILGAIQKYLSVTAATIGLISLSM